MSKESGELIGVRYEFQGRGRDKAGNHEDTYLVTYPQHQHGPGAGLPGARTKVTRIVPPRSGEAGKGRRRAKA